MQIRKILSLLLAVPFLLTACGEKAAEIPPGPAVSEAEPQRGQGATEVPLRYATQFHIYEYPEGYSFVTLEGGGQFLVVPEGQDPPTAIPVGEGEDIPILQQPVENIYLEATSAMCLFDGLDALPNITMSGTEAEGWHIENARAAMERGEIAFAGEYDAPDYEMILAKGCELAVESTMIDYAPEAMEKLTELGIPVLRDLSGYEPHPLGRTEWIKLYGLLTGKEELAARIFDEQAALLEEIPAEPTGKTVAYFYIDGDGGAAIRKSGDYMTKMIELAGGEYAFTNPGDDLATGAMHIEMERFYAEAKDADVILYNSLLEGELRDLGALLAKSELLADFKAVQNGDVWCTTNEFYQESTGLGVFIADLHGILTGDEAGDPRYLNKLE